MGQISRTSGSSFLLRGAADSGSLDKREDGSESTTWPLLDGAVS